MRTVVAPRLRASSATRAYVRWCSSSARRARGCARISARKSAPGASGAAAGSGNDTGLAPDADALDLEVVVQNHEVGGQLDVESAERGASEDARRNRRRGPDRLGERDAEPVQVTHRLDHGQRAPSEDVTVAAHDALTYLDL